MTRLRRMLVWLSAAILGVPAAADGAQPMARASSAPYGTTADGQAVDVITLRNRRGMQVRLLTRGGAIIEILAPDRHGVAGNVALAVQDFLASGTSTAFNSIVGRYANRISGGGFRLDGQFFALNGDPQSHIALHGGLRGFGAQVWQATTFEQPAAGAVRLDYVSPDGDNGFPGELATSATFTLDDSNTLQIDYRATTTRPTVVNLTHHIYFTLGAHEHGPVYDQWLQVFADRYTPTDERLVPTGEILGVAGTPFDFRVPAPIAEHVYATHPQLLLARGLDHNLVLARGGTHGVALAARLWDPGSGRQLAVWTSEPAIQVYSGNNFNGATLAADRRTLRQGDGITFETQHFPDSPNQAAFPSTVLRPGEVFQSTTRFAFSTDAGQRFFQPRSPIRPKPAPRQQPQQSLP
jgi:aldose 1-epimerase